MQGLLLCQMHFAAACHLIQTHQNRQLHRTLLTPSTCTGHALNKVLKDFILKYELLQGKRARYVPGWDCHGLPIELKVLQAMTDEQRRELTTIKLRRKARDFALKAVNQQREGFKRFGTQQPMHCDDCMHSVNAVTQSTTDLQATAVNTVQHHAFLQLVLAHACLPLLMSQNIKGTSPLLSVHHVQR